MRIALGVLVVAFAAGCGDGAERLAGRGLEVAPPEPWKPHRASPQPGDDARRSAQLREYHPTHVIVGSEGIDALVADSAQKRESGLAFVDPKVWGFRGMLFQMPYGEPRLDLANLEFDVDAVLIDIERSVLSLESVDAPGGAVGAGSAAKYILVVPRGGAQRLGAARGRTVQMSGGMAQAGGGLRQQ